MENEFISRSMQRENDFLNDAKKGHLSSEGVIVYSREIRKLIKDGFYITDRRSANIRENPLLFSVTVDWCHAFPDGIPHKVYSYINYIIDTPPKEYIKNYAQLLFVIAQRANLKPSK